MQTIFPYILAWALSFLNANPKEAYLSQNRQDLNATTFEFPKEDFNLIGFGAYHGSQKTEKAELRLLDHLTQKGLIEYYIIEADYALAHFFNVYLESGDDVLLKDLIKHYGIIIGQDRSVATFQKWKALKTMNDALPQHQKIKVLGTDVTVNYKYVAKHILDLCNPELTLRPAYSNMARMVKKDTTDFSAQYDSYSKKLLREWVDDYDLNKTHYFRNSQQPQVLEHLVRNLKATFSESHRETEIFKNYMALDRLYDFKNHRQFARYGFFHLEKDREGAAVPFFARLIDQGVYPKEKVLSVIGYFMDSEVLWDVNYDEEGHYVSHTNEGGFGIGDYEDEYFRGIDHLKKSKISDMTLFRLNRKQSPYHEKSPDLIEIIMPGKKSNGELVKGKATTDYLDYALLISDSKASEPLETLNQTNKP
ncbi:hypothetical protein [Sediminicola luteus]|uniref:Erythromycin esterase n=1 Tax=Sediminicola luteus TaxID=319238 RepID=A0A2A4G7G1_9FLAO|nr:hypothetical protein [Sediminicola luteus]PCE64371.1 hypothetical protein B7P33_08740 [Sediminicola luteus]